MLSDAMIVASEVSGAVSMCIGGCGENGWPSEMPIPPRPVARGPYPMASDSEAAVKSFCALLRSGRAEIRPWAIRRAALLSSSGGSGSSPWSCHSSKLRWTERSASSPRHAQLGLVVGRSGGPSACLCTAVVSERGEESRVMVGRR
eukprot:3072561-Prymnesium_polylepis.2